MPQVDARTSLLVPWRGWVVLWGLRGMVLIAPSGESYAWRSAQCLLVWEVLGLGTVLDLVWSRTQCPWTNIFFNVLFQFSFTFTVRVARWLMYTYEFFVLICVWRVCCATTLITIYLFPPFVVNKCPVGSSTDLVLCPNRWCLPESSIQILDLLT